MLRFKNKQTYHSGRYYSLQIEETRDRYTIKLFQVGSEEPVETDEGLMKGIRPSSLESYVHTMATQWGRNHFGMGDLIDITKREIK